MKFKFLVSCLLLLAAYVGAADKWGAFSDPFPIRDAAPFGEFGVILATDGGIRYRTPLEEAIFHSENGLETSRFNAVVTTEQGTYAISEFGLVAKFQLNDQP